VALRIYAFAKELGLDNKQLLDICEQAGVKGKGSALANLEDHEVDIIKNFMSSKESSSQSKASPAAGPALVEPRRDDIIPSRAAPLRDLTAPKSRKKEATPESLEGDIEVAPAAEVAVETETTSETARRPLSRLKGDRPTPTPPPEVPDSATQSPAVESQAPERMTPERAAPLRPLQNIQRAKDPTKAAPLAGKKDRSKKSNFNVASIAAMPDVKQPSLTTRSDVKVQKPDIAIPHDAIAKARSGAAPLEQFTKHTKTKDKDKKKGKGRDELPSLIDAVPLPTSTKVRGKFYKPSAADDAAELGSTRQHRDKGRGRSVIGLDGEEERYRKRRGDRNRPKRQAITAPRKENVTLQLPCNVRTFSEAAGVSAVQVLLVLPKLGENDVKNINSDLSFDVLELLLDHFDISHVDLKLPESVEDRFMAQINADHEKAQNLVTRPPIVTFLGHVDHGKTSLLDTIIGIDVVSGEAGGITQHIRAYQIEKDGKKISFVDTPGHEAFTEMRARGANVTDIAVLVIAADDGVMPQTEEAISHAKAAKVPIIVAMNKIDLPGANPEKVYQDLARHELLPSEWGGDVEVVKTSATKNIGIDDLLETILVTAELHDYKADLKRAAYGTCLEAEQQPGRGVIAKMMVQGGTLRPGDILVCGSAYGRVKAMYDTLKVTHKVEEAGPSTPVNITGLDEVPEAGDKFYVLPDIAEAREIAIHRESRSRQKSLGGTTTRVSLEEFQSKLESGTLGKTEDLVTLNLIIRADARGSIEAIQKELSKIEHPEIRINILQALVGGISIADVRLAQASQAVIIGFNVVPDEAARSLADELQVEIRRYDIIYKVSDDIKATLEGRLKPDRQVVELGSAMVLRVFSISRTGTIAGCRVMRGSVQRDGRVRLIRDSRVIGEYAMESLKREKDDAKEVQRGMECGIKLAGYNDIKEGDTFEIFKIEEVARTL
jgi:translation initiation factor IF-2